MEAVCGRGDSTCEMYALAAALHSLHLYCASVAAALMCCCCTPVRKYHKCTKQWRGQNVRGIASLALFVTWCCGAAAALLRPNDAVHLVSALIAPLAWLAAAVFHIALWTRHSAAPVLYLAVYWLLSAACAAIILRQRVLIELSADHAEIYFQGFAVLLSLLISAVDCVCFYDEVTKRFGHHRKQTTEPNKIPYMHNSTHFYAKISFFWLNSLLYKGYEAPLEEDDLGDLPENERSIKYYRKISKLFTKYMNKETSKGNFNIWACYIKNVWPNFYIGGVLKLFSDLIGIIPPLGLAVIIQYIEDPNKNYDSSKHVTVQEFYSNGYVMLLIVTLALISQAFLSQNATHMVTVEGTRLKTALQAMVYDKCMRLAPWTSIETEEDEESSPLLHTSNEAINTRSGLLTNLVSQDTYNIMSCVWICHYLWAIPLKVAVILYCLYTKLGASAIFGTIVSILVITPLQFYIGKKLSDNSKEISKCTDHRISKMSEILQGINVIKLYVWEDLFKEKILQLREVELKMLNKDSIYWSFLTFTTQISTVLLTVITFTVYYFIENDNGLTTVNVFAGLALFNQLTVPLLILPVTVLMVIQAMVSTKRIRDFLELPEANNVSEDYKNEGKQSQMNDSFVENTPDDIVPWDSNMAYKGEEYETELDDQFPEDDVPTQKAEHLVSFRNAVLTWGMKNDLLEVDDLDIPAGQLIMVVGATGSGKSSLLSAVLGEMYLERGDYILNGSCSMWFAGQPPWLLEGTVKDNIVMGNPWCQRRYAHVLRATGLRPDLQILPEGDSTRLGSHGTPLSGGQRIRVCVARALYSNARLLAMDEPLAALDASLARHVVARGLLPAARAGRTVIVATNRLELLHYADLIIAMEEGRVIGFGRAGEGVLARWAQLAAEARAAAARIGAGPPGGTARERTRLVRALSRAKLQTCTSEDALVGITEAAGAHLLAEVSVCTGGSWRRTTRPRPTLARQLSSPPPSSTHYKWRREVRRAVSADESNAALHREASLLRRLLQPRAHRTLTRWTPRTLRRLISSESDTPPAENNGTNGAVEGESKVETTYTSLAPNGVETNIGAVTDDSQNNKPETEGDDISEMSIWWEYARACGWWGVAYWAAAATAQTLALVADCWLAHATADTSAAVPLDQKMWSSVCVYAAWSVCGACVCGCAQGVGAAGGARARRALHGRLLRAALLAPLHHHSRAPLGDTLYRFSADILVIDKKLTIAVSRWAQLALLCVAALLVNAVAAPGSLLALLPAVLIYILVQNVYLRNARELQRAEAQTGGRVVSLCGETCAGGGTVRAGRLQPRMRAAFLRKLDHNHNALLLLNTANRWLGLILDLVGAASVCVSLGVAMHGGSSGAVAGLAGAYSLLLPAYLAHLAKCRADLDQHLAALHRIHADTNVPQEDYRDDCAIPSGWQRNGKIEFENVSIQHEPGSTPILNNINITVAPGEKVAICGRSGSGKSTLLLSCAGATTIGSGRVLVDGADVTRVPLHALRHRVVVLPQDTPIFSGTLRENLDPLAMHTDEEIWLSLKAVGLYEFVTTQTAGLECAVGGCERGWSAGRRGRAGAARVALRARLAAALLLDEPAAALDAPNERVLLAAIAALAPTTTILTVAHRISSVRGYDRAVVLEEGRVVEQGEVSALLAQPGSRLARMLAAAHRIT